MFGIDEIGWDGARFVGRDNRRLGAVFKLYPWEWMVREKFGAHLEASGVIWIEPAWKMLLSNKAVLPILWELFPDHPNLLAASRVQPDAGKAWVRKPLLGREGANVTLHAPGRDFETAGDYGAEGFVYQDVAPLKSFEGKYPVIGSWVIGHRAGDVAAGMGIRESDTPITTNVSQFALGICSGEGTTGATRCGARQRTAADRIEMSADYSRQVSVKCCRSTNPSSSAFWLELEGERWCRTAHAPV